MDSIPQLTYTHIRPMTGVYFLGLDKEGNKDEVFNYSTTSVFI
ncbi:hypothetical protein PODOV032v1_p0021 [Vibrio phage 219E41.1]|nr:hypothetical protein PODOV021v1_p0016 [Vibrio phage 219E41.2]QZI91026.1 hypothetical protein PODOV032v1_p0021 [Vibrio phage 219E41.1]QZI91157.1 hypothetical protein PODOV060v1_p0063 [Vibrio phage 234P8]QZI91550.1 hypothetical protein PODOV087v1_p0045 [Vibrio phage 431E45.1]QZI91589.1 hypothetical protein PODOV086v1_p0005 [Vibrio phage 431E46.1]QZI91699.1 hypothetical protein PODOV088v1_p0038 [Vibrio phage 431E48.2]